MKGYYLYGIVAAGESVDIGSVGLDGALVYTIPCRDIAAVVHDCDAKAYSSDDKEVVKAWIISHQAVVEMAWERFGTIAPVAFDTIIKDERNVLKVWLSANYESLSSELKRLKGMAEYGVQVSWDVKKISEDVIGRDDGLVRLQNDIQSASEGISYLYKKKMEQALKARLDEKAKSTFGSIHDAIKAVVADVVVEKIKAAPEGRQMIMNVSCLLPRADEQRLGKLLDGINGDGYEVRFTGPWPPYSFVKKYGTNTSQRRNPV